MFVLLLRETVTWELIVTLRARTELVGLLSKCGRPEILCEVYNQLFASEASNIFPHRARASILAIDSIYLHLSSVSIMFEPWAFVLRAQLKSTMLEQK